MSSRNKPRATNGAEKPGLTTKVLPSEASTTEARLSLPFTSQMQPQTTSKKIKILGNTITPSILPSSSASRDRNHVLCEVLLHGMPAGQAVSRFGSAIFFFYTGCPQGRPCQGLGRLSFFFFTRDARRAGRVKVWVGYLFFLHGMPAGQAVSRFESAIFFFFYTGCPQGRPCQGLGRLSFSFFTRDARRAGRV